MSRNHFGRPGPIQTYGPLFAAAVGTAIAQLGEPTAAIPGTVIAAIIANWCSRHESRPKR